MVEQTIANEPDAYILIAQKTDVEALLLLKNAPIFIFFHALYSSVERMAGDFVSFYRQLFYCFQSSLMTQQNQKNIGSVISMMQNASTIRDSASFYLHYGQ